MSARSDDAAGALPLDHGGAPSGFRMPSHLRCALALVAVKAGLTFLGFGRTFALAGRWTRKRSERRAPLDAFSSLGIVHRVALVAAFFPGRAECLEQSLALFVLLRRRGVAVELRLGVQPYPFTAHAWIEYEGVPLNESRETVKSFVLFPRLAR